MNNANLISRSTRLTVAPGRWRLWLDDRIHLPSDTSAWQLRYRGPHSRIYAVHGAPPYIAKFAMPRSLPRDAVRKYVLCQARREYRGNRLLLSLGVHAPAVYGWGLSLNPLAEFESVLFMEPLPAFTSGLEIIREEHDAERRIAFLESLADQLGTLHSEGYVHRDLHFDNLCVLADDTIVWIDNDIRRPRSAAACRARLAKTLDLLRTTARGTITIGEWHRFHRVLHARLSQTTLGERLLDEIPQSR